MPLTQQEAVFIMHNALGCRVGTTIDGAAYSFSDIVGNGEEMVQPTTEQTIAFCQNPNSPQFQPRWDDRLWNTCGVIIGLSTRGTVLLVTLAYPTGERYRFNSAAARGDRYSFRKTNRLPPDSQVLASIPYDFGGGELRRESLLPDGETAAAPVTRDQVKALYDAVTTTLGRVVRGDG
jgi:hypothetical protein